MSLLARLPDDLLVALVSDWVDPGKDLRTLAEGVLGLARFGQLVAHGRVTVRATKVLSKKCLAWLRSQAVPVELWKTHQYCNRMGGRHEWRCNGQLHRDGDLPAIITANGNMEWVKHGRLHRGRDRPAMVWGYGAQAWCKNGKLHRDGDRPAIVSSDGSGTGWYRRGIAYFPK